MHGRRCCHAPPLSNTACRSSISAKLTGHERLVFCLDSDLSPLDSVSSSVARRAEGEALAKEAALRGYIDAPTGILISAEVPNPPMPANDKDEQLGRKAGTLGRHLPGLAIASTPAGLTLTSFLPASPLTATIPGAKMDEQGFLIRL